MTKRKLLGAALISTPLWFMLGGLYLLSGIKAVAALTITLAVLCTCLWAMNKGFELWGSYD